MNVFPVRRVSSLILNESNRYKSLHFLEKKRSPAKKPQIFPLFPRYVLRTIACISDSEPPASDFLLFCSKVAWRKQPSCRKVVVYTIHELCRVSARVRLLPLLYICNTVDYIIWIDTSHAAITNTILHQQCVHKLN